jgi:hypothetical protein
MLLQIWITATLLLPSFASADYLVDEHQFCEKYVALNEELTAKGGPQADGCGSSGYLIHFGHRFCNGFVTKNSSFSPAGQQAMYKIRHCLLDTLAAAKEKFTCDKVKRAGIDSHLGCYMSSGFCQMPIRDKMEVYYLLKTQAFSWDAILNSLSISDGCRSQNRSQSPKAP